MLEFILIFLCFLAVYHHVGFPLILKLVPKKAPDLAAAPTSWPKFTLIVPAYNEEKTIIGKIINTAKLDYPADKLELVIACDGCTDETVTRAKQALTFPEVAQLKVRILDFKTNRGKVCLLNEVISETDSELIALSDCSGELSKDALIRSARHFQQKNIGVVGATYQLASTDDPAEKTYWAYQRAIKKGEASFGAPMGMHGAFYAFRKSLWSALPERTINDDFVLPMKIVAQGFRALYDEKIICFETENTTPTMNWKRRLRISAGNMQQALYCLDLLNLKQPGIAFCFFSGKFLRAWMGLILVAIAALSAAISPAFFALQLLGLFVLALPLPIKIIHTLRYITIGHLAGFLGALRFLMGFEKGAWKRAN